MKISEETSQKIKNMSLLCAVFVVWIHCGYPKNQFSASWFASQMLFNGITGIAVPFFFLISGFFIGRHNIESDEYRSELKKRLASLVIPFYIWNTLFWIFGISLTISANILHGADLTRNISFDTLWNLTGFGLGVVLGPLWYMRTLVLLIIVSPLIVRLNKHWTWLLIPASCIFIYLLVRPDLTTDHPLKHFIRFLLSPTGLLYFSFGIFISRRKNAIQLKLIHCMLAFTFGCLLLFVRAIVPQVPGCTLAIHEFAIPFLMIGVWHVTPSFKLPQTLSGISFLIYVMHMFFIATSGLTLKQFFATDVEDWKFYIPYTISISAISIFGAATFKMMTPKISSSLSGGRS